MPGGRRTRIPMLRNLIPSPLFLLLKATKKARNAPSHTTPLPPPNPARPQSPPHYSTPSQTRPTAAPSPPPWPQTCARGTRPCRRRLGGASAANWCGTAREAKLAGREGRRREGNTHPPRHKGTTCSAPCPPPPRPPGSPGCTTAPTAAGRTGTRCVRARHHEQRTRVRKTHNRTSQAPLTRTRGRACTARAASAGRICARRRSGVS
jgi:hypothetical protein